MTQKKPPAPSPDSPQGDPPCSPRKNFFARAFQKYAFQKYVFQKWKPPGLAQLKYRSLRALLLRESASAQKKVAKLRALYPEASPRELAYKLVEEKKTLAGIVGGVSGSMGFLGIPLDAAAMAWLQAGLLAEVAGVFHVNVKTARGVEQAQKLLDEAGGVHFFWRVLPKTLGGAAVAASKRLGALGKALPLISAPLSAYFNHRHLQAVGEEAIRRYDGFPKAHQKLRRLIRPNPSDFS